MNRLRTSTLYLFIISLILVPSFWFLILPQVREMGAIDTQIAQLQGKSEELRKANEKRKADQQKLRQSAATALALMPVSDNQYDLLIQIEALSKSLGLTLTSLSITGGEALGVGVKTTASTTVDAAGAPKKIAITLAFSAPYSKTQEFVKSFGQLARYMSIDQLTLGTAPATAASGSAPASSGGIGGASDPISVQLTAYAFYIPKADTK